MMIRGTVTKQGWELDRDGGTGTKPRKKVQGTTVASANSSLQTGNEDEDDDSLLESTPFACIICKRSHKYPIVTKCRHYYFCEALRPPEISTNSGVWSRDGWVFSVAKNLSELLE